MRNLKVKLLGRAVVITIDMSVEELERATKIMPEVTKLLDKKGDEVFRVAVGPVECASNYGFCFVTNNAEGKAEVTRLVKEGVATKQEVTDELAQGLIRLDAIIGQIKNYLGNVQSVVDSFFEEETTPVVAIDPEQMTLDLDEVETNE